jgi:hypothetical protein
MKPNFSKPPSPTLQPIKVRLSAFPTKRVAQCTAALTCSYFGQYKKFPPGNTVEEHAQNDVTISAS